VSKVPLEVHLAEMKGRISSHNALREYLLNYFATVRASKCRYVLFPNETYVALCSDLDFATTQQCIGGVYSTYGNGGDKSLCRLTRNLDAQVPTDGECQR